MSDKESVGMSEKEANDFLLNGRILRIASVEEDGSAHVAPIWYVYEKGKLYLETPQRSRKVRNIKANNRVAFSVDVGEGHSDLKAVVGKGTAEIVKDRRLAEDMSKKILIKYLGDLNHPVAKQLAKTDDTVIQITPTKKIGWDYTKE